ncbi:hypothetical protein M3Y94_00285400 [Aphelenchoides besseyi]|nr:hypothetical protein M3Y94_00285400 [Aphelenchoides besseyi]KAI6235952.1 hypothetical protein M3Y95_00106000 [Aphelenchoides besseyi]
MSFQEMRKVLNSNDDHGFKDKNDAEAGLLESSKRTESTGNKKEKRELRSQLTKLTVMIVMTFVVFLVELFYGYFSNSVALIADSFHMLSDVLALSVALACILIAKRRSKTNTFGWVRAEVVGALVNGVFLLALCFSIFIESIERLLEPHELKEPLNVLIVGIIGLLVNLIGMFLFHGELGHSHSHGGHDEHNNQEMGIEESSYLATSHQDGAMALADLKSSERALDNGGNDLPTSGKKSKNASQMNMKGVYLHIVTDFIGSVIVIVTASVSLWWSELSLLKLYMDPVLSMIMVILIMISTIPLVHETALILLQTTPNDVDVKLIEQKIMRTPGVIAVHEFHVWRLVGVKIIATVHIRFQSLDHYLKSAQHIRDIFHNHQVHSVTVQPEFTEMTERDNGDLECMLKCEPEDCKAAACCADEDKTTTPNYGTSGR